MQQEIVRALRISVPILFLAFIVPMEIVAQRLIQLPRTGQSVSYYPGDDGDIQAGVPWPSPRFTDHANGTVTDNLTGLMWTKNGNLVGYPMIWEDALDYVEEMNSGDDPHFCL